MNTKSVVKEIRYGEYFDQVDNMVKLLKERTELNKQVKELKWRIENESEFLKKLFFKEVFPMHRYLTLYKVPTHNETLGRGKTIIMLKALTFKNNEVESAQLLRFDSFKHKILNVDYYPDTWGVIDHGAGIVDKTWIRDQIPSKFSTLYETRSMKEYLSTEIEIELFEKAFKIIQEKEMENEALPF